MRTIAGVKYAIFVLAICTPLTVYTISHSPMWSVVENVKRMAFSLHTMDGQHPAAIDLRPRQEYRNDAMGPFRYLHEHQGLIRGRATAEEAAAPIGVFAPQNPLAKGSQCGGIGGLCPMTIDCQDALWPGYNCPMGFFCGRRSAWVWKCLADGEPEGPMQCPALSSLAYKASTSTPTASPPAASARKTQSPSSMPVSADGYSIGDQSPPPAEPVQRSTPPAPVNHTFKVHQDTVKGMCGGKSVECFLPSTDCIDAQWASCPAGLNCIRDTEDVPNTLRSLVNSQWWWECNSTALIAPGVVSSASKSSAIRTHQSKVLGMCGGKGGACSLPNAQCVDAQWASCPTGTQCVRNSEWWWACNVISHTASQGRRL